MKRRAWLALWALAFLPPIHAAEIGLEFSGVLGGGKDLRVALTNKATGATHWVSLGANVAGYTVSAYDEKSDVLVLAKDRQQFRLPLKEAKRGAAASKPSPEIERAVLNNLRQLAAAADQFYLENGKSSTTYDDLVGPTKYVRSITPVNGENYRALQFMQGKTLAVVTASGQTVSYQP